LHHLHHQLALSLGNPCGVLGETRGNSFLCEVGKPFTFLGFKISKPSDRFAVT
jgi:hypothetical protein